MTTGPGPTVYLLHGYAPHEVPATTELILRHKHPDDVARALDVLEEAVCSGAPFSCYHRILDVQDRVRSVLSVGRGLMGPDGRTEQLSGFFVDLTRVRHDETHEDAEAALLEIAQTRLVLEQAKGIVMVAAGCDADEALALLRDRSARERVKINVLARGLTHAVARRSRAGSEVILEELFATTLPEGGRDR